MQRNELPLLAHLKAKRRPHPEATAALREETLPCTPLSEEGTASSAEDENRLASISRCVTPLYTYSYPDQLEMKRSDLKTCMKSLTRTVFENASSGSVPRWCSPTVARGFHGVPVSEIIPSPPRARLGYRNKCEFAIGLRRGCTPLRRGNFACIAPEDVEVGFVHHFSRTEPALSTASGCLHVPPAMVEIARTARDVVAMSGVPVYIRGERKGVWRFMMLRLSEVQRQAMVVFLINDTATPQQRQMIRRLVLQHVVGIPGGEEAAMTDDAAVWKPAASSHRNIYDGYSVESVYLQYRTEPSDVFQGPLEHVWGRRGLTQCILGLTFNVNPGSFFQTNTLTCELLYEEVLRQMKQLAAAEEPQLILDVCCGTGTIALLCARRLFPKAKIIGVEILEEAVKDAEANAALNEVPNVTFRIGKAEDVLPALLRGLAKDHLSGAMAVVDPPRCGLHPGIRDCIRDCQGIRSLVYASCNGDSMKVDLERICAPTDGVVCPFVPIECTPVDMFPHTLHCEVVVCLQRRRDAFLDAEEESCVVRSAKKRSRKGNPLV